MTSTPEQRLRAYLDRTAKTLGSAAHVLAEVYEWCGASDNEGPWCDREDIEQAARIVHDQPGHDLGSYATCSRPPCKAMRALLDGETP